MLDKYGKMLSIRGDDRLNVLNTYNEFDTNHFDLNVDHYGAEICGRIVKLSAHLSHKKLHKVFSSLDIFVVYCLIYLPIPE
ncbi:hypothetical protein CAC02_06540 [Streptococcus gallolyticus]|uniref:Uncharacterized protein n=1 Tax=Streptococcus gallolyticus TaxID=315405 RepID=A0A368UCZ0_9STRE|nr:hypothetical protein CAC02_06540 [Streptococcus gallolyticus]